MHSALYFGRVLHNRKEPSPHAFSHSLFMAYLDLSELDNLPAQVRREASETVKVLPLRGTVVYGAPLKAKILAKLLMTAVNLFKGGKNQNVVEFTETETEARAWLDRRRRELAAAAA